MWSTIICSARSRRRSTCSTGIADTTNLPAGWHRDYLETLYKGNKLAEKGGIKVAGTPIDIDAVKTPAYVQAGREDHIAPPQSVWKIMDHFAGAEALRARGLGPYRRRGQSARGAEIPILGQ